MPASQTPRKPKAQITKAACLNCHGPFDKLAEKTHAYKTPSGETATPHRHVPHEAKDDATIPECQQCHQPHPLPPMPKDIAAVKSRRSSLNLEFCYKCHHIRDFTSCKTCHQG